MTGFPIKLDGGDLFQCASGPLMGAIPHCAINWVPNVAKCLDDQSDSARVKTYLEDKVNDLAQQIDPDFPGVMAFDCTESEDHWNGHSFSSLKWICLPEGTNHTNIDEYSALRQLAHIHLNTKLISSAVDLAVNLGQHIALHAPMPLVAKVTALVAGKCFKHIAGYAQEERARNLVPEAQRTKHNEAEATKTDEAREALKEKRNDKTQNIFTRSWRRLMISQEGDLRIGLSGEHRKCTTIFISIVASSIALAVIFGTPVGAPFVAYSFVGLPLGEMGCYIVAGCISELAKYLFEMTLPTAD